MSMTRIRQGVALATHASRIAEGIGRRCKTFVAEDCSAEIRTESLTVGRGRLAGKAICRSGERAAQASP